MQEKGVKDKLVDLKNDLSGLYFNRYKYAVVCSLHTNFPLENAPTVLDEALASSSFPFRKPRHEVSIAYFHSNLYFEDMVAALKNQFGEVNYRAFSISPERHSRYAAQFLILGLNLEDFPIIKKLKQKASGYLQNHKNEVIKTIVDSLAASSRSRIKLGKQKLSIKNPYTTILRIWEELR